ncbi:radical SAM/SPASM domain-containing protein [Vitreimonas sp.]|uniref:radical SAM/SPASM domain-containing protein n=1 Tax=Vitreimonas sp. TaxID=3069702 RepID=UPI002ED889FA
MSAEQPLNARKRGRALSAHALKAAGVGAITVPSGPGALFLSLRLRQQVDGLRCMALSPDGAQIAQAPLFGDTRVQARLPIPDGPRRTLHIQIEDGEHRSPDILDARTAVRSNSDAFALPRWTTNAARWRGDALEVLHTGEALRGPILESRHSVSGEVSFEAVSDTPLVIGLWLRDVDRQTIAAGRYWLADGPIRAITPFRNLPPGRYQPSVVAQYLLSRERPTLHAVDVHLRTETSASWTDEHDTYLPQWGKLERLIHRACKRSPAFNAFVQGIEFRLGREELISMPRYMSFCPTGQCNAQCDFCSVTINRTGIIKKEIDRELIDRFTAPVRRTVAMYGLEGNGEPTLHRGFPELVQGLTASDSEAYLITNGSRFSEQLLPSLMRLESVNVSLNAATAETHRAVMKLKEHDTVVEGLKRIVQTRGFQDPTLQAPTNPRVSVSFVATRQNAHEVEQFLTLAEDEIGVDVALIRPLSELGNELGSVEDLRDIVPFESDLRDLIDAVEDYKAHTRRKLEIRFEAEAFKSVRPDPLGQVRRPLGMENRLLAPRPRYWSASTAEVSLTWQTSRAFLSGRVGDSSAAWEAVSAPIPVLENEKLRLILHPLIRSGALEVIVEGDTPADIVWRQMLSCGAEDVNSEIGVGHRRKLRLRFRVAREIAAEIDFECLRTPSAPVEGAEHVLRNARWEVCLPNMEAHTSAGRARIRYEGAAGPYLLKSYALPVEQGSRVRVKFTARVNKGELGVGLLSSDQKTWLATSTAKDGSVELEAWSGQDSTVRLAVYAANDGELAAELDLSGATITNESVSEEDSLVALPPPSPSSAELEAEPVQIAAPPMDKGPLRLVALEEPTGRSKRYFCHKPWSDLHNFTVDGRMDVCCIATGPSQERYSLGNLREQSFQEVWNGATAKLFRRTVNSDKVLPPCARCPMGYQYHGTWYHKEHTLGQIAMWLRQQPVFRPKFMHQPQRLVSSLLRHSVSALFFRNFR